ncbi:MAG: hypothetical protein AB7O52_08720 [Planctomycetota bacterium]
MLRKLVLGLATFCLSTAVVSAQVTINEIRIDQNGSDCDEYFELSGAPATSLNGIWYLVIGDGTGGSGVVETALDLSGNSVNGLGLFAVAEDTFGTGAITGVLDLTVAGGGATCGAAGTLVFENNDNVTHMLVQGFTGAANDDLDTDDDGVFDVTPWTSIVDSVSLIATVGSGDQVYSATTIGPDGTFVPGHVYRCPDGTGAFQIGPFAGGFDTVGAANLCMGGCAIPASLDCDSDCGTGQITLDWNLPMQSTYTSITITRDTVVVATLAGTATTFTDIPLATGQIYAYEVIGECAPGMTGIATCSVDHCPCAAPTSLVCASDCGPNNANLTWANGDLYASIEIYRDAVLVATLGGMATSHTDFGLAPGMYSYEVRGICGPDFASATCGLLHCLPVPNVIINEVRLNTPGADDDEEFAELIGPPGTALTGLTYLVIGDSAAGSGVIEAAVDLSAFSLDANGFFVFSQSDLDELTDPLLATGCINYLGVGAGPDLIVIDLNFENADNVTHMVVQGFSGTPNSDLDTNDDGVLDSSPWIAIVDSVGIVDDAMGGDFLYSANLIGPSPFGQPDHIFRCVGGFGGQNVWRIGSLFGCPAADTPGAVNTCPTCFEILDLQCVSDCVTGNITLTWTNDDTYTDITVLRNGLQVGLLAGNAQTFTEMSVPGGPHTYELIGTCAMGTTVASCDVIHGVYSGEDNVIFAGEGVGGASDSVALLQTALISNGQTVIVIDRLDGYACFNQFTANTVLWVMNGTFPNKYLMTVADGQALVNVLSGGNSIYIEGAGIFDFDPATPFLDYDGVDNSISTPGVATMADDSLTSLDGGVFSNLDVSALQDVVYNQDNQGGNDFNANLIPTGTTAPLDIPGGSAGLVWNNNPDALPDPMVVETAYGVGVFYKTPPAFGDVLSVSFEFGGYGGDQLQLAGLYAAALRRSGMMTGPQFKRGDCNNDNSFNIADAITILGFLFPQGTPPALACRDACDANDDGNLNIADAVTKLGNLFPSGPPTPLPAPFMACGEDPTMDSLDCTGYMHCP